VTGTRPTGYNSYWFRPGVNTLEILAELGFTYHIDDLSADEPFLQIISGQPFATVPYTAHLNDIARPVVGPQGPDRPVGSRPSRYHGLGRPRPGTSQRAPRPQQLTAVTQEACLCGTPICR
jgi:hypothetical protein